MFTYIMPTILKTDRWKQQLPLVLSHPLIKQVIIVMDMVEDINIDLSGFPNIEKCKVIYTGGGGYCNGAWNYALEQPIPTENIVLANDDIVYDTNIFDRIANLNLSEYGIIGAGTEFKQVISRTHGFGQLMFMIKYHFTPIPEGIKHWFGDDWIFYNMSLLKMPNYTIDIQIGTNLSESSQSQYVQDRIAKDFEYWDTIKEPFKPFFYQ